MLCSSPRSGLDIACSLSLQVTSDGYCGT
jgi:hypothetical protein